MMERNGIHRTFSNQSVNIDEQTRQLEDSGASDVDDESIRTVKAPTRGFGNDEQTEDSPDEQSITSGSRARRFSVPSLRILRSDASSSRLSVAASYSTWSTNMTMSNIAGAGRTLGNLYSFAGRRLERGILQLVTKTGRGPDECADRLLGLCQSIFAGWPFRFRERWMSPTTKRDRLIIEAMGPDCERLLRYAGSHITDIQFVAFRRIVDLVTRNPQMRRAFKTCCESRNALIDLDAIMFSWKKNNIESETDMYSHEWLLYHQLATMCLGKNDITALVDKLAYLSWSLDRSAPLAGLIELCQGRSDPAILATRFLWGYTLDYDAPRQQLENPVGLQIRFWEDMLELDQTVHDNLVNVIETKIDHEDDFEPYEDAPGLEGLVNVILEPFRKDIKHYIEYSIRKGDFRVFLTVWKIVKCARRGKIIKRGRDCPDVSRDWRTWLALHLDALQIQCDEEPYVTILQMAPLYWILDA